MYFDLEGEINAINHKTGDTLQIKFNPKSWRQPSHITGKAFDKSGKQKFEISGSWTDEIFVKSLQTGENNCVWTREAPIEFFKEQYGMRKISILLNHLENKGIDPITGNSIIAPTDSRFRGDQRLFELGKQTEADEEKVRLEIKQRKARKDLADRNETHKVQYFEKYEEANPWTGKTEDRYRFKQGPDSYWEKRKRQDWTGAYDLF